MVGIYLLAHRSSIGGADARIAHRNVAVPNAGGVLEAMRRAGTAPQIVYAYRKTGRLLMEDVAAKIVRYRN